jgi:hypothetical protein
LVKFSVLVAILASVTLAAACDAVEVPLPGAGRTLYRDEFVQGFTGSWQLEHDDLGSSVIVPEQMLIELNAPNLVQYAMLEEPAFSDFALEVEAGLDHGSPSSTYGILFRMQGPQEFYRFAVTADGMYIVERHNLDGSIARFTNDWRSAVAINQGAGSRNTLRVEADGPRIAVYVNEALLEEVRDESYRSGNIALSAGTFDGAGAQVSFDNLFVYPP